MKRIGCVFMVAVLMCVFLSGCGQKKYEASAPLKLVSHIEILYDYRQSQLRRLYTDTDKIDVVLHYLHKLTPYGLAADDPEYLQGDSCKITVHLSDGSQHIYRMRGSRYLSVEFHQWQNVDYNKGSVLFHLFRHLPSD